MTHSLTFDAEKHEYALDGRVVPSVTTMINAVISFWKADDYYLQRGTANHAVYALIARGEEFTCDPVCEPFADGCRLFFADIKPLILLVEHPVYSVRYQYAGTLDLIAEIDHECVIIDWKGNLTKGVEYQLGAYWQALQETVPESDDYDDPREWKIKYGYGVQITKDGKYKISERYDLKKSINKFLSIRTVYGLINS